MISVSLCVYGPCSQIISGVSVGAYWTSTFVFDVMTYLIPCAVFLGLIYAFDVPSESLLLLGHVWWYGREKEGVHHPGEGRYPSPTPYQLYFWYIFTPGARNMSTPGKENIHPLPPTGSIFVFFRLYKE